MMLTKTTKLIILISFVLLPVIQPQPREIIFQDFNPIITFSQQTPNAHVKAHFQYAFDGFILSYLKDNFAIISLYDGDENNIRNGFKLTKEDADSFSMSEYFKRENGVYVPQHQTDGELPKVKLEGPGELRLIIVGENFKMEYSQIVDGLVPDLENDNVDLYHDQKIGKTANLSNTFEYLALEKYWTSIKQAKSEIDERQYTGEQLTEFANLIKEFCVSDRTRLSNESKIQTEDLTHVEFSVEAKKSICQARKRKMKRRNY
jgi:hypothetical protein